MRNMIFVKPAENLTITFPEVNGSCRFLDRAGELVPKNNYWLRRLKEGDVFVAEEVATND